MTTTYDWIVERLDTVETNPDDPDILEVNHFDRVRYAVEFAAAHQPARIALVRETGNDVDGMTGRLWAYAATGEDGGLPTLPLYFEDSTGAETAIAVPTRFHAQVRNTALGLMKETK